MTERTAREHAKLQVRRIVHDILDAVGTNHLQFCSEARISPAKLQQILQTGNINLLGFAAIAQICHEAELEDFAEELASACQYLLGNITVQFPAF